MLKFHCCIMLDLHCFTIASPKPPLLYHVQPFVVVQSSYPTIELYLPNFLYCTALSLYYFIMLNLHWSNVTQDSHTPL
jgi:hypothetical protein